MRYVILPNPLWSAQLQILGGPFRLVWVGLVYAAILLGAAFVFRLPFKDMPPVSYAAALMRFLGGAQCAILLIGGASAIGRALLRDNAGRMIESHRMAPMSAMTVVLGYMVGPCFQVMVLFSVGVVFGIGLAMVSGNSAADWLRGNTYILVTAWSMWSATVFFSLKASKRAQVAGVLLIAAVSARGWMELLPPLGLVSGMTSVLWCWHEMLGTTPWSQGLGVVLLVNILMGLYWTVVAVRRFRKPHHAGLSPLAAWFLGAIWVVVATLGLTDTQYYLRWSGRDLDMMTVAAVLFCLCLAVLPFLMAVHEQRLTIIRDGGLSWSQRLWPWSWTLAGIVLVVVQTLALARWSASPAAAEALFRQPPTLLMVLGLAVLMACTVGRLMFYLLARHMLTPVVLLALWMLPVVVDFVRIVRLGGRGIEVSQMSALGTSSPLGVIIALWYGEDVPLLAGLACMGGITVLTLIFGNHLVTKLLRKRQLIASQAASRLPAPTTGT